MARSLRAKPPFRTALWLAAAYLGVLVLVGLFPPQSATSVRDTTSTPAPTPRSDCVVCGIGETCDPDTGQCMFVEATPLPCVKGTKFDDRAGFCLPEGNPTIAPAPTPGVPGEPAPPFDDLPGFGGEENAPDPDDDGF